jgi:murein DD-endopeptidase MepM/ murein hydrolase activator NlpD
VPPKSSRALLAAPLIAICLLSSCEEIQNISERARPATAHEQYANSLRQAGLDQSGLARLWLAAARHVVAVPVTIALPFSEAAYFPASEPRAVAYRIVQRRGQRLVVDVQTARGSDARVFVDLFAQRADGMLHSVASADLDTGSISLRHEGDADSAYVVRVQPELLQSARVTINVRVEPLLAFPLPNANNRSIQSFWGAARDGGRRQHQGVDIFAPRGTPVLAVASGYISHVGHSRLGGNVVWLRDSRFGQNIYYAHLDTQLVRDGQRVRPGDTLGTVGTTGNAKGGVPHLHFGIYRRGYGAIDPVNFIRIEDRTPPPVRADTSLFGILARNALGSTDVRSAPSVKAPAVARLERGSPFSIDGASGDWFRVRTETGVTGYIAGRAAERADEAIRIARVRPGDVLREDPDTSAIVTDSVTTNMTLPVLGALDGFLLVRTAKGGSAWLQSRASDGN